MAYTWQKEQKESTHQEILEAATRLLSSRGMRDTSVARLMKEAGLTVGGFYAHFRSKDEMILAGFRKMMVRAADRLRKLTGSRAQKSSAINRMYLSPEHRDRPDLGCPVLALAFEAGGKSEKFRQQFAEEIERGLRDRLELLDEGGHPGALEEMMARFSTLIGAQLLARATRGSPLSDRILEAAIHALEKSEKT